MVEYVVVLIATAESSASLKREISFRVPSARITRVIKNNGLKRIKIVGRQCLG